MKKYSLNLLFSLPYFAIYAQLATDSLQLSVDNDQPIDLRNFDRQLSEKYPEDDFKYAANDGDAQNLIQRFLNWFFQTLRDNFGIDISPEAMQLLEYFIYILMGSLIIYLLVRFLIGENVSAIFGKPPKGITDINLSEDHIEQLDLDALLKAALAQKDFRLAIRYQYLKALKTLSQKNIIEWHYEKTNSDYQSEITAPTLQLLFKEISYLYDYIWYGEQYIDESKYTAAVARFHAMENIIPY